MDIQVHGALGTPKSLDLIRASFPGGSNDKESPWKAGDLGLIPVLGRFPGEGNGSPVQYSCLENSMDRGAWRAIVHGCAKNRTQLSFTGLHQNRWQEIVKSERKNFESRKRRDKSYMNGKSNKSVCGFHTRNFQVRRKWNDILKGGKKLSLKNCILSKAVLQKWRKDKGLSK